MKKTIVLKLALREKHPERNREIENNERDSGSFKTRI